MNINLLADLLQDVLIETTQAPEAELSEEWREFEQTLGKFKEEYARHLREYTQTHHTYTKMKSDLKILENLCRIVTTSDIQEQIRNWINQYKVHPDFEACRHKMSDLGGKVRAMERVLVNTNANRYTQFTCSICMDRYVDTFIDPCGHLACNVCLSRTQTDGCPMCRSQVRDLRRMFPAM